MGSRASRTTLHPARISRATWTRRDARRWTSAGDHALQASPRRRRTTAATRGRRQRSAARLASARRGLPRADAEGAVRPLRIAAENLAALARAARRPRRRAVGGQGATALPVRGGLQGDVRPLPGAHRAIPSARADARGAEQRGAAAPSLLRPGAAYFRQGDRRAVGERKNRSSRRGGAT